MPLGQRVSIAVNPGVDKDDQSYTATQYVDAQNMRFYRGLPQKLGGSEDITSGIFDLPYIDGVCRSIYTFRDTSTGIEITLFGTDTTLYALVPDDSFDHGNLVNITPIGTATVNPGAGTLTTYLYAGINFGISTIEGSNTVELTLTTSPGTELMAGDDIFISGATGPVGGIPASSINGIQNVSAIFGPFLEFTVDTTATSSGIGGGAAITVGTQTVTVTEANTYTNGQRIKITGAVDTNGFTADQLNIEAIIRNAQPGSFDYEVEGGYSTSAGASSGDDIVTAIQITMFGSCDLDFGSGYGGDYYGINEYGGNPVFSDSQYTFATTWSFDRFQNGIVMTPGGQSALYVWYGDINVAPTLVSLLDGFSGPPFEDMGAFTTNFINYVFTAGDSVCVFGLTETGDNSNQGGVNISSSQDLANWNLSPGGTGFVGDIPSAARLTTSGFVNNQYLLGTENIIYVLLDVGAPRYWKIEPLLTSDGVLGQKAMYSTDNFVMWIGNNNFYTYNGAIIDTIPNNTMRQWFYDNLTTGYESKVFLAQNLVFSEIWVMAPFYGNAECNTAVMWNFNEGHFTNNTISRTASENYTNISRFQYMVNGSCSDPTQNVIIQQEIQNTYTVNGGPMVGHLTTNDALIEGGQNMLQIERLIPTSNILPVDSTNVGQLLYNVTVYTKEYDGQEMYRTFGPMNVYDNTQKLEIRGNGRQWKYEYNFNNNLSIEPGDGKDPPSNVGFRIGDFYAELKPVTPR